MEYAKRLLLYVRKDTYAEEEQVWYVGIDGTNVRDVINMRNADIGCDAQCQRVAVQLAEYLAEQKYIHRQPNNVEFKTSSGMYYSISVIANHVPDILGYSTRPFIKLDEYTPQILNGWYLVSRYTQEKLSQLRTEWASEHVHDPLYKNIPNLESYWTLNLLPLYSAPRLCSQVMFTTENEVEAAVFGLIPDNTSLTKVDANVWENDKGVQFTLVDPLAKFYIEYNLKKLRSDMLR